MGCCRGSRSSGFSGPAFCRTIEKEGAHLKVWPVNTSAGLRVLADLPLNGRITRVDLLHFLPTVTCNGPTARWIRSQLSTIIQAVQKRPQVFVKYSTTGLSLSGLVQLSRGALRNYGTHQR